MGWYARQGGLAISIIAFAASLNDIDLILLLGHGCSVLAENFDALKRLGELYTRLLANLGVVFPCPCLALCPGTLHLAGVAVKRVQLRSERVSDIEKGVWLLGAPEIDFPDLVGLQPFLQMLRIRQRIPGVGKNCIQGHTTTDRVVAVTEVAAVGVYRD